MSAQKATQKTAKKTAAKKGYDASAISVLEGLEPVRKRPGMYIGTTGPDGLHHLITEVFDNSRDEAMGGFADRVEITLLPDNYVRVADNGRGIPVDKHKQTKVSALETILTTLHAGGKFGGAGYKVSGGLHGVGVSVVNALSTHTIAEVHRDGAYHIQEYEIGKPKAKVKKVAPSKLQGTIITFQADETIFKEIQYDFKRIVTHMRQQAYLVKGFRITVIDARELDEAAQKKLDLKGLQFLAEEHLTVPHRTFYFESGLRSMVAFNNQYQKPIHKNIFHVEKGSVEEAYDDTVQSVEIALQYVDDISSRIIAFANNIYNPEHGTHVTGFKTALTRTLNNYAKKNNLFKEKDGSFTGDDVLEGITVVISIKMPEIQFEGQTKAKLGSVEARSATETVFADAFSTYLEENPDDAKAIINKVVLAVKARKAAKAAKDSVLRKGALDGLSLPGKLADCQTKKADESELFIVEGDSAGGSAKMGRDRRTQAVLPLRGKILNVERARIDKMLASEQIKNLVIALGTAIGDVFDESKLRYHKIIIATDADVDGAHIRTLLLTLFYRYFRPLIDGGYIYIAQPPLYKLQKGKEIRYALIEEEKFSILKEWGVTAAENPELTGDDTDVETADVEAAATRSSKVAIHRYKGLGEMNAEQLAETTMQPENRVLKQVAVEDAEQADKVFDILMGTDVASRKSFIQSNAKLANLDI
ncbi:MAG: DNA gyrase subunit B [Patescibacteria group bacterium]